MASSTSTGVVNVYVSAPSVMERAAWTEYFQEMPAPKGLEFRFAFRHDLRTDWTKVQQAIRTCDVMIADMSPTPESGGAPDPNVITEATIARLGRSPKRVLLLHEQSSLTLPFAWRQLMRLGGIQSVGISDGIPSRIDEIGGWLADLVSKPLPPPPPPRQTNQATLDVFVSQPMQRGDGRLGFGGFDFARFFHALRAAAQTVKLNRKVRLAVVKKDKNSVDIWHRIQGGIARSSLLVAEMTPDAQSGSVATPDVVTEAALASHRYDVPIIHCAQEGVSLPQDWAAEYKPVIYRRNDLESLTRTLVGELEAMEAQLLEGPKTRKLPNLSDEAGPEFVPLGGAANQGARDAMLQSSRSNTTRRVSLLPPGKRKQAREEYRDAVPAEDGSGTGSPLLPKPGRFATPPAGMPQQGNPVGPTSAAASGPFQRFLQALSVQNFVEAHTAYQEAVRLDPWQHALFNPDRFESKEILGAGAFGVVFRATKHPTADDPETQDVVIKVLLHPERLGQEPDQLFSNLDLLRHAPRHGMLPVLDWDRYPRGEAEAYWHFWSPWVDGLVPLDRLLRQQGQLNEDDTAQIAAGIVTGLMSAHLFRVPHLALKPQNVLLKRTTGAKPKLEVYLRDFGFFPDFQAVAFNEPAWGELLVNFAAPEQRGEVPTTPGLLSDIYSVGLVVLTCLFGKSTIDIDTLARLDSLQNPGLKAAVEGALRYDPRTRFSQLEPLLELLKPGTSPVDIRDTMPIPVGEIGSNDENSMEAGTGRYDMFGEARVQAVGDIAGSGVQDPVALDNTPRVLLRGATREEGPLRPVDKLNRVELAPETLIEEAPLPPRPRPLPTYTGNAPRELIVGIDLGTCNSLLAYIDDNGDTKVIHHSQESIVTPSAVFFPEEFKSEVGLDAKRMAVFEPMNVAQFFKLNMGDSRRARPIHGTKFSPEMLSALVLRRLVEQAVEVLGGPSKVAIKDVVVTVPSSWDDVRRESTRMAAKLAGLNTLAILSEPVAVALETALRQLRDGKTVLVYDFGGGTFDVTIFRLEGKTVRLLANMGLPTLGGNNLDQRLYDHVRFLYRDEFEEQDPPDPDNRPQSRWELLSRCEQVKIALCKKAPPQLITVSTAGCSGKYRISLEDFERLIAKDIETTRNFVLGSLLEAGLQPEDIDFILSVGGSSQIPLVQRMLGEIFGAEKLVGRSVNPQETVARGACRNTADIWAEAYRRGDLPQSAIPKGLPEKLGDAPVLREETPQAISVVALDPEDESEIVDVVIPQGAQWPGVGSMFAETAEDHQTNVICRIRSGSSADVDATERLGTISFPLIPGVPKGCPIKLEFWYDGPDRLFVAMWDGASGQVQTRKVPWPGPTARQLSSANEIVSETEVILD